VSDAADAMKRALAALYARARAERTKEWVSEEIFTAYAAERASSADEVAALHAADLFTACAAARGNAEALAAIESEHLSRVREFAASVDATPQFVAELTQELRARIFVGDGASPPRILAYSGRGSLGAWIRVSTTRLALDQVRARKPTVLRSGLADDDALPPHEVDPELGYLKDAYGEIVNRALADGLAMLEPEARGLLKMHYVDALSIEQVGVAFGVSRATAARMLAAAREKLLENVRVKIAEACGARGTEADSLLALVRSRLDLSLASALRTKA
jgi:RNA polymerase sigma-70 factor, ECF subfamily